MLGLHRIEDLSDVYDGVVFGGSLIAGGHGGRYANSNGIEVELQLTSFGLELQGGYERIRVVVHERGGEPHSPWYWPGRSTVP